MSGQLYTAMLLDTPERNAILVAGRKVRTRLMTRSYAGRLHAITKWFPAILGSAAFAFVSVLPADAQSRRPDTRTMTCSQVQSMIERNGAVVMTTGRNTFDRFVFTRNSCPHGDVTRNEWVTTKDVSRCLVRICVNPRQFRFND